MSATKKLSVLQKVPLKEAWKHEASDFTPWLSKTENLDRLAEALNLSELILVGTEHWVGDFKLDILCTYGDEQVIIENQLDETDHKHLGQILTYAGGVGAKKVIWVAESFRPEHLTALQFLNENSLETLSFFGVQIELWKIDDSPLAPKFEVVVKPNDWAKIGRERARVAANASPTKQLQLQFWEALIARLTKEAPNIKPQKPIPQHWLNNAIGRAGFGLNFTANTKDERLGVELWIPGADAKKHFANLSAQKKEIEDGLGFTLDWQELPDAKGSRIASWYEKASIKDESRWDEYLKWLTQRVVKMDQILRPIVKNLP